MTRIDLDRLKPWPDLGEQLPAHAAIVRWLDPQLDRFTAGDRLPAEIDLADALGVSRMTLRQALATLEERGRIERRRGRNGGTFVSRPRFDLTLTGLPGFTEQMRRAHVEAGAVVVRAHTIVAPDDVRQALHLRPGSKVHEIIRVRSADGEPIALEDTFLPAATFPNLLEYDVTGSLYELMDTEFDRAPASAEEVVEPVAATPDSASLLKVRAGRPLMLVTRTSYDAGDTPVEFARDLFRPDRTRIVLRTRTR